MTKGPMRRQRRMLTPEEKWQVWLEVSSGELTQTDAARKWASTSPPSSSSARMPSTEGRPAATYRPKLLRPAGVAAEPRQR